MTKRLANTKISARQRCVFESPWRRNHGKSTQGT